MFLDQKHKFRTDLNLVGGGEEEDTEWTAETCAVILGARG